MIELTLPSDKFSHQVGDFFKNQPPGCRTVRYAKSQNVYTSGERDASIYYIESGQVKLLLTSYEGKQCLASIRTTGDILGELCLSGQPARLETAGAMQESVVKKIAAKDFIAGMKSASMLEGLVQYLAMRVSEQLEIICALTTADSEHRLARTLLHLGRVLGTVDSRTMLIQQRISHEELSAMVGTTRPRVGIFLKKFRQLGLVQATAEGCLLIEQEKMKEYLMHDPKGDCANPPKPAACHVPSIPMGTGNRYFRESKF